MRKNARLTCFAVISSLNVSFYEVERSCATFEESLQVSMCSLMFLKIYFVWRIGGVMMPYNCPFKPAGKLFS